jgi:quercetin dioxygenase-like cupin family protein
VTDSPNFTFFSNLAEEVTPPDDGTLSRTVHNDNQIKVILFGFAKGEELSEHTSSMPAIIQIIEGEAEIGLGERSRAANAGSWIRMQPNLKHSVKAKTPVVMLLTLLK